MKDNYLTLLKNHHQPKPKEKNISLLSESLNEADTVGNIASIMAFGLGGWGLWRAIRAATDKASKKCGTFTISDKRDACIVKARIEDCDRKIKFIENRKRKDCKEKRDPDKCRKSAKELIEKQKDKKKKYKKRLDELKKEGRV